ncbi:MAG: hypothetical protein ABIR54_00690 [Burkholderiaceae bacterium]
MSLDVFVRKCGTWGLLPNNGVATNAYGDMSVMAPMMGNSGYSGRLNKLCMKIPDLDGIDSLEALKGEGAGVRLSVILTCHEIIHNLHRLVDNGSFVARSKARVADWDNEEEQLTIAGDTGTVALPGAVMLACNPRLFNEHSLCRILRLSNRTNHHCAPVDVSSAETVDLKALPKGVVVWM